MGKLSSLCAMYCVYRYSKLNACILCRRKRNGEVFCPLFLGVRARQTCICISPRRRKLLLGISKGEHEDKRLTKERQTTTDCNDDDEEDDNVMHYAERSPARVSICPGAVQYRLTTSNTFKIKRRVSNTRVYSCI